MSKSRKILGALLAVVLVLNVFAVSAFASIDNGILEAEGNSYSASMTLAGSTDTSATVKVVANYALGPIQFRLSGITLNTDVSTVEVAGYYDAYELHVNADGLVFILPDSSSAAGVPVLEPNTEVTITVKGTKTGTIAITGDAKTSATPTAENMALRLDGGTVQVATIYWGQTLTISNDGTTPTPPAGGTADLAKTATAEAGVLIDTHKTFGGQYAGVVYGFTQTGTRTFRTSDYITKNLEATNGGTLEFGHTISESGYGTGTTIIVKNSDGTVSKVYVVVIFGDANGDGALNGTDTTTIKKVVQNANNAPANSVKRMACNVQPTSSAKQLHNVIGSDTTAMKNNISGKAKIDSVLLASYQFNQNEFYQ